MLETKLFMGSPLSYFGAGLQLTPIDLIHSDHFNDRIYILPILLQQAIEKKCKLYLQYLTMFATRHLLLSTRITFFTRETCGLCNQAKHVLSDVWDKKPFAYTEVNVDLPKPESKQWRDIYDFDVPVVSLIHLYGILNGAKLYCRYISAKPLHLRKTPPRLAKLSS